MYVYEDPYRHLLYIFVYILCSCWHKYSYKNLVPSFSRWILQHTLNIPGRKMGGKTHTDKKKMKTASAMCHSLIENPTFVRYHMFGHLTSPETWVDQVWLSKSWATTVHDIKHLRKYSTMKYSFCSRYRKAGFLQSPTTFCGQRKEFRDCIYLKFMKQS